MNINLNNTYQKKYLKYKLKYKNLKALVGGGKEIKVYYSNDKNEVKEFMQIDFEEGDDIETVKTQIIQKINNPKFNTGHVVLREFLKGHCKPSELKTIGNNVSAVCFGLKNQIDLTFLIPVEITSGESTDPIYNYEKTITTIPRPKIELLRPRILRAVRELEESGKSYITWDEQSDPTKFIKIDLPTTETVVLSEAATSNEATDSNALSDMFDMSQGPPPPPRLEKSGLNFDIERNDIMKIIEKSQPYEIHDVRLDTNGQEYKLWLKNSHDELIEVVVTLQGKVKSVLNKGPILKQVKLYGL